MWNKIQKQHRLRSKRLAKKYGDWILAHNAWSGKVNKRSKWLSNEYDAFSGGWRDLWHMCIEDINKEIHKSKRLEREFYFMQIKEKYGEIRAYTNFVTKEIDRIIEDYSFISANVCQRCGKPDSSISKGCWVECCCKDCYEKEWKGKEHKPYEEAYDTNPEHTIIPDMYTVRHFNEGNEWNENIDISKKVKKVRDNWSKKQERKQNK